MKALVEAGAKNRFGADDVDRFEAWNAREQIEVSHVETVGVRDPIGHGDDRVSKRMGGGLGHEPQAPRWSRQPRVQAIVELVAGDCVRAMQLERRASSGHYDYYGCSVLGAG